jgi:hypothetical protein
MKKAAALERVLPFFLFTDKIGTKVKPPTTSILPIIGGFIIFGD